MPRSLGGMHIVWNVFAISSRIGIVVGKVWPDMRVQSSILITGIYIAVVAEEVIIPKQYYRTP